MSGNGGKDRKCWLLANRLPLLHHILGNPAAEKRVSATTMGELCRLFERGKHFMETYCRDQQGREILLGAVFECFCPDSDSAEGHNLDIVSQILREIDRCLDRVPLHLVLEASQPARRDQLSLPKPQGGTSGSGGTPSGSGGAKLECPGTPALKQQLDNSHSPSDSAHRISSQKPSSSGRVALSGGSEPRGTPMAQQDRRSDPSSGVQNEPAPQILCDQHRQEFGREGALLQSGERVPSGQMKGSMSWQDAQECIQLQSASLVGASSGMNQGWAVMGPSKGSSRGTVHAPETSGRSLPYEVPSVTPSCGPDARRSNHCDQAVPVPSTSESYLNWAREEDELARQQHFHRQHQLQQGCHASRQQPGDPQRGPSFYKGRGIPAEHMLSRGGLHEDDMEEAGENFTGGGYKERHKNVPAQQQRYEAEDDKTPSPPWTAAGDETEGVSCYPNLAPDQLPRQQQKGRESSPAVFKRPHWQSEGGGNKFARSPRPSPPPAELLMPKALMGQNQLVPEPSSAKVQPFDPSVCQGGKKKVWGGDIGRGCLQVLQQQLQERNAQEESAPALWLYHPPAALPPQIPLASPPAMWPSYPPPKLPPFQQPTAGWFPPASVFAAKGGVPYASFPGWQGCMAPTGASWPAIGGWPVAPPMGAFEDGTGRPRGAGELAMLGAGYGVVAPQIMPPQMWRFGLPGWPGASPGLPSGSGSGLDGQSGSVPWGYGSKQQAGGVMMGLPVGMSPPETVRWRDGVPAGVR